MTHLVRIGFLAVWFQASLALSNKGVAAAPIKLVSWNVLYGFNHGQAIKESGQWIGKQAPDIVAFQELNGITEAKLSLVAKAWGHTYAVTHKEDGFPVGLTSKEPITVIHRQTEGFHHGFLHCRTYGIDLLVVHFWPGKNHEVAHVLKRGRALLEQGKSVMIVGDLNGCSRKDRDFLLTHATLRTLDYSVVDMIEADGFIDLVHKHDPLAKVSCPSMITIPKWSKDLDELKKKQYRIDFIFADPSLAKQSHSGTISLAPEIKQMSDHFPVVVEFHHP